MSDAPPDDGRPEEPADRDEPFADAPDRWAEADAAWQQKWSDDPDAADDPDEPALPPPGDAYQPTRPTTGSVTDAYGDGMREAGPHLGLGLQIGGSMALFVGLGIAADRFLGTTPWGVLAGASLGMVGIFFLIARVAREADTKKKT